MSFQPSLDLPVPLDSSAYAVGLRASGETHGVVLTKGHIVELILDLAGYKTTEDLGARRLLEPSCGHGAFLRAAASRLLISARIHGRDVASLSHALTAFDIDEAHVDRTREALLEVLEAHDVDQTTAHQLVQQWVNHGDFLLAPLPAPFDFVIGNPPYVRIEQFSQRLQAEYRRRFRTIFDRADLYVAFIERGLDLLSETGVLSFICADRWTLNQYGRRLRAFVASTFHVHTYVDLHQASPFDSDVIAYPSIFTIGRVREPHGTRVLTLRTGTAEECADAVAALDGLTSSEIVTEYPEWFSGESPWVLSSPKHLATLRFLEQRFPPLEHAGLASVRIGVATGCDSVYLVPADADIESSRLVPLVMRDDIRLGQIHDAGRCVINTSDDKGLISLEDYPRLKRYLLTNETAVRRRHVSKGNHPGWFKTIDRVYPDLVSRPKLLIPDIAGANEVAFDKGQFYPHHNLYFVIANGWDLEVLGGLLSSRMALFFVWSYAVKMRGGYLRFQAQYLRRIRLPEPDSIPEELQDGLRRAFRSRNFAAIDTLACVAYGLARIPDFDFVDTRK
jgi:adenine-specific DNA-methyltransferase